MAIATLEQWGDLYDLADQLKERKPWHRFEDIDLIQIKLPEYREAFTCSIMGKQEFCPGISLHYGIEGYSDVMMLMESGDFPVPSTYVMGDIHSLTCYYGNQEELDDVQRKRIQELGRSYHGDMDWTYFLSFEPRYSPSDLTLEEVKRCTLVFRALIRVLDHLDEEPDQLPDFEHDELLKVTIADTGEMKMESILMPEPFPRYKMIELPEDLKQSLKEEPKEDLDLALDLNYLFTPVHDPDYDRPLNPLILMAYDLRTDFILHTHLLSLEDDEVECLMAVFIELIEEIGRPAKLYVRNPTIYYALESLCKEIDVPIQIDALEELDEIYEHLRERI